MSVDNYYNFMHGHEIKLNPGAQEGLANLAGTSATVNPGNHTVGDLAAAHGFNSNLFGGIFDDGFLPSPTGGSGGLGGSGGSTGGIGGLQLPPITINPGSNTTPAPAGGTDVLKSLGIDTGSIIGNVMVGLLALMLIGLGIYVLFGKQINQAVIDTGKAAAA